MTGNVGNDPNPAKQGYSRYEPKSIVQQTQEGTLLEGLGKHA